MNRLHIIIVLLIVAVGAALGLSYQFYFKEKFNELSKAKEELRALSTRLNELDKRFKGQKPDEYLRRLGLAISPLSDAADARALYFNMGDYWKQEEVPEDVKVPLKFYYERQFTARAEALRQDALAHVPPCEYPANVFLQFGAPDPSTLANAAVLRQDVQYWLTQMNFATAMVRKLIKANAYRIENIVPWPPREEYGALEMRTLGLSLLMRAEDLIVFVRELQRENRYFNVNAIRLKNRYLLSDPAYGPPYLEVEMLLTLSRYVEGKKASGGSGGEALSTTLDSNASQALMDAFGKGGKYSSASRAAKKSFWRKLWPF